MKIPKEWASMISTSTGEPDPIEAKLGQIQASADKEMRAQLAKDLHNEGRVCAMLATAAKVDKLDGFAMQVQKWADLMLKASRELKR